MPEPFLYLTTTGRRTGNPHSIEIWYVDYGGAFYLCAGGKEKTHWALNILANQQVTFSVGIRDDHEAVEPVQPAHGTVLSEERDRNLHHIVKSLFQGKYGWSDGLLVEIRPDNHEDNDL